MKTIHYENLADIHGGGQGRTCFILGGLIVSVAAGSVFQPSLFGSVSTLIGAASIYGCFN